MATPVTSPTTPATPRARSDRPNSALRWANVGIQQLTVDGALENDRDALHRAIKLDPLTAAELTLNEIHEMTEERIDANAAYLSKLD